MKYELKIEFQDEKQLENVIQSSYFEDGQLGKLVGKKSHLRINNQDPLFSNFKGLNNATVKVLNEEMLDGSMRCVVDENDNFIDLYPINNFCIFENKKYTFY